MSAASTAVNLVHYRTVEVAGVEIFYREAGDPNFPTLLLLHGFPTSSHMFRDLIPLLADRYHLIAPDYPGFGYSSTPKPSEFAYTFDRLADVMEQFVDALGLTKYSLYMQPAPSRSRHDKWALSSHFRIDGRRNIRIRRTRVGLLGGTR